MKNILYFLIMFVFASLLHAETSFKELQSLTNIIAITHHRTVMTKLLSPHLKVLEEAEKGGANAPSAEATSDAIDFTNAYYTTKAFDNKPLSEIIPKLFDLLENDELTNYQQVFLDGKYTNTYGQWVYELIFTKMNIDTNPLHEKDQVTMLWFPRDKGLNPWSAELTCFWYYSGLKHLPTLWNDWYSLWKLENQREFPRTNVLERLSKEISKQFSYHLFPFVAKAIEDGDQTLEPLIDKLPHRNLHDPFMGPALPTGFPLCDPNAPAFKAYCEANKPFYTNSTTFVSWWNNNKDKYIIPQPKTTLADFKHVVRREYRPMWIDETKYKNLLSLEKALDDYCALEERPISNCWYFSIKDEDESTQK